MRRVVLVGDSIRMRYEGVVHAELRGIAEVWGPAQNGEDSEKVLRHLDEWVLSRNPDIVHINCGLHDLKRPTGSDRPSVPIERYRANVRTILDRIQKGTHSLLIWATTTPVNELWHKQRKGFERAEGDVVLYNRAAMEVAKELQVEIDDLYSVVMQARRDLYLNEDGVHLTPAGSYLLGRAVAGCIRTHLEKSDPSMRAPEPSVYSR
jgi:lysophospholipase L1-like esterase